MMFVVMLLLLMRRVFPDGGGNSVRNKRCAVRLEVSPLPGNGWDSGSRIQLIISTHSALLRNASECEAGDNEG